VLPGSNSSLDLKLGYSEANFLVLQILAHDDAETQLFVVNNELAHRLAERQKLLPDNFRMSGIKASFRSTSQ